jgi:Trypsin
MHCHAPVATSNSRATAIATRAMATALLCMAAASAVAAREPAVPPSAGAGATAADAAAALSGPRPRIVNGRETQDYPAAAALLDRPSGLEFCSAVLVGCRTVLTAAHCVCDGEGSDCQPGGSQLVNPATLELFFQHAGFFSVQSIAVPPLFEFGIRDDIAVLRLTEPVDGIRPLPVNSVERLALGSSADIVGFGLAGEDLFDNGLKRTGRIVTTPCTVVPGDEYVCWEFDAPIGAPGTDSNTCSGDSGGPLVVDFGSGELVAGVGSGGLNADCQPDDLPFDADVFANLAGIASAAGADLDDAECGSLPVVGGPAATEIRHTGEIAQGQTVDRGFQVPAGALALRVGLNAEEGLLTNELDLAIHRGGAPPVGLVECASTRDGGYEFCEVAAPAAGTWNARVVSNGGDGTYQLTITILREVDLGPCVPGPQTLCIDDAPGDGRFEATIAFDTAQSDGQSGMGKAIELDSLGVTSGGIFWFFNQENPEVLLKVLDGCTVNGHHWVFWSAGTNVRLIVTVTDRRTGRQRIYQSPDRTPALPVTDILAFSC